MTNIVITEVPANPRMIRVVTPITPPQIKIGTPGPQGLRGPTGAPGEAIAFEYAQETPLATWTIPIPETFTRKPAVTVYQDDGTEVDADIVVSGAFVTVSFPSPATGSVVLT